MIMRTLYTLSAHQSRFLISLSLSRGVPPPHPLPPTPFTKAAAPDAICTGSLFVPHVLTVTRKIAVSRKSGSLGDFSCHGSARGALHTHPRTWLRSSSSKVEPSQKEPSRTLLPESSPSHPSQPFIFRPGISHQRRRQMLEEKPRRVCEAPGNRACFRKNLDVGCYELRNEANNTPTASSTAGSLPPYDWGVTKRE